MVMCLLFVCVVIVGMFGKSVNCGECVLGSFLNIVVLFCGKILCLLFVLYCYVFFFSFMFF